VGGDSKLAKGEDKVESLKFDQTLGHLKLFGDAQILGKHLVTFLMFLFLFMSLFLAAVACLS